MSNKSNSSATSSFSGTYLRFCEYYDQIDLHDKLYAQSKDGLNFKQLMPLITSDKNIMLAYRTIKSNKGAMTPGVDGKTILDIKKMDKGKFIIWIRNSINNFNPGVVRRVHIPKANGKTRPLGIPTIKDRIIQQCFKQILEPILEAKFYKHSYGFRPIRSTKDALAELYRRLSIGKNQYVVDVDIKGFFDNVNHKLIIKLLKKQGIRDPKLLKIISIMLKAEIENEGIPEKGVPQGGILSPLLSNLVLNELDWYVANQWESFQTKKEYKLSRVKYNELNRTTNLKSGFIVRYADDFKICCKTRDEAERWFAVVKKYLKEKLQLDIAEDKSGVVDCKETSTDFLGINFLIKEDISNKRSFQVRTKMTKKAKETLIEDLRKELKSLKKHPENAGKVNTIINGKMEYFNFASEINLDTSEIFFRLSGAYDTLIKQYGSTTFSEYCRKFPKSDVYSQFKEYNYKVPLIQGVPIIHIKQYIFKQHSYFNQNRTIYTLGGRDALRYEGWDRAMIEIFNRLSNTALYENTQFNDNKLSRFGMTNGKCEISGFTFTNTKEIHGHHVIPKSAGGSDEYNNLIIIHEDIHQLIHTKNEKKFKEGLSNLGYTLKPNQIKKLRKYRDIANSEVEKPDEKNI